MALATLLGSGLPSEALAARGVIDQGEGSTGLLMEGLDWSARGSSDTAIVSGVVFNSSTLSEHTTLFEAGFQSRDWTGLMRALRLRGSGQGSPPGCVSPYVMTCGSAYWDAAELLASQDWDTDRQILSYSPARRLGIPFRWDMLSAEQQGLLQRAIAVSAPDDTSGEARARYLRGDSSDTGDAAPALRRRRTPLGDIVNSEPVYAGPPAAPYGGLDGYASFRRAHATRAAMVYVGANDGMLHGFDASTGKERIGYVPGDRRVFADLPLLAQQDYPGRHRFLVDGFVTVADARTTGGWRTLLVGGLRAGGQTMFALDVTAPTTFAESAAANIVLWEFGDRDDADFGYSFGRPAIVKLHDGRFAVLMANGYFSNENDGSAAPGRACLFLVSVDGPGWDGRWDLEADYRKLCAPREPDGLAYNGLSSPAAVDIDGDHVADAAYAGDLQGNLWKFDLGSSNAADWQVAYGGRPLFRACNGVCSPATRQPITARPEIGPHPLGAPAKNGVLVYFGTGQDFMKDRPGTRATQSLYMVHDAFWDTASPATALPSGLPLERSSLRQQEILHEQTAGGEECGAGEGCLRVVSNHAVNLGAEAAEYRGWFLDLKPSSGRREGERPERLTADPVLHGGRISYRTSLSQVEGCRSCGDGWLMELDFASGGRTKQPPFDIDADGRIDHGDLVDAKSGPMPVNGRRGAGGPSPRSTVLSLLPEAGGPAPCRQLQYERRTDGVASSVMQSCNYRDGRQSWRQIR